MRESAVVRSREDHFTQAKLFDPSKPLEFFGVDQTKKETITVGILERNDVVNGITNDLGPGLAHVGRAACITSVSRSQLTPTTPR